MNKLTTLTAAATFLAATAAVAQAPCLATFMNENLCIDVHVLSPGALMHFDNDANDAADAFDAFANGSIAEELSLDVSAHLVAFDVLWLVEPFRVGGTVGLGMGARSENFLLLYGGAFDFLEILRLLVGFTTAATARDEFSQKVDTAFTVGLIVNLDDALPQSEPQPSVEVASNSR